jgi:hypothetical protein
MFTRGARGDANAKRTLDARTPASGRSVLTAVRSLLRCAPWRTLARVPPFVLRSAQNPAFPYRLKRRGVQGGAANIRKEMLVLLAAASAYEKCRKVTTCLRTCSQAPPFSGFASARGFTAEYVVACASAHRT